MHLDRTNHQHLHDIWNKQVQVGDYVVITISGYMYPTLAEVLEVYPISITVRNPFTNRKLLRSTYEYTLVKGFKDFDKTHPELFI